MISPRHYTIPRQACNRLQRTLRYIFKIMNLQKTKNSRRKHNGLRTRTHTRTNTDEQTFALKFRKPCRKQDTQETLDQTDSHGAGREEKCLHRKICRQMTVLSSKPEGKSGNTECQNTRGMTTSSLFGGSACSIPYSPEPHRQGPFYFASPFAFCSPI